MKITADFLLTVSAALFVLAVVFLVLAVILFIFFRIPDVVGDLSGKEAKNSIRQMYCVRQTGRDMQSSEETELLGEVRPGGTEVLTELSPMSERKAPVQAQRYDEVILVHTDEEIPI